MLICYCYSVLIMSKLNFVICLLVNWFWLIDWPAVLWWAWLIKAWQAQQSSVVCRWYGVHLSHALFIFFWCFDLGIYCSDSSWPGCDHQLHLLPWLTCHWSTWLPLAHLHLCLNPACSLNGCQLLSCFVCIVATDTCCFLQPCIFGMNS